MSNIEIIIADLANRDHAAAIVDLTDGYAREPIIGGKGLPEEVRGALIERLKEQPAFVALLALEDGEPAGVANCFFGFSTFQARPLLNVHDLAVRSASRGRGIGRALLDAVEAHARAHDCCKVTLEVRGDNRARRLYERTGFSSGDDDGVEMFFMTKKISS